MKSYKFFSILLILIILFSLSLTGCSPEPEVAPPENHEEEGPSEQEDTENNELNKDSDSEELDKSENEESDAEKDPIEENEAREDSENSIESDGEDVEEITEEDSESKDSSSDDTGNEEVSSDEPEDISQESENEEENQKEEINFLKIEGSVENPLFLNLDDLKKMEDLIYTGTFYSLNSFGTTEYTDFKGVKLWNLLNEKALISEEASMVKVIAVDGYSMEFTVDQIKRDDYIDETNQDLKLPVILAWEENGQEYDPEEGPPYKLVIGQKEPGDVNKPQWVRDIDKIIVE